MKNNQTKSRRAFLKTAAKGAVIATVAPAVLKDESAVPEILPEKARGANDLIRIAVLGIRDFNANVVK